MSPELPKIKYDPYDRVTQRTLPNGARHWHYEHLNTGRFIAEIVFLAGSRYDPADAPGLAHLTEHLVSKNGDVSYDEASDWFRTVGSWQSGWCGLRSAGYGFTVYSQEPIVRRAFGTWRGMLAGPVRQGFEHEVNVIRSERAQKLKVLFVEQMMDRRRAALFGPHPLGSARYPIIGDPDALSTLSVDRVEEFRSNLYVANRLVVITAGDDRAMAEGLVDEFCSAFPASSNFLEDGLPMCVPPPVFGGDVSFREEASLLESMGAGGSRSSGYLEAVVMLPANLMSYVGASVIKDEVSKVIRRQNGWSYGVKLAAGGSAPDYAARTLEVTVENPNHLPHVEDAIVEACRAVPDRRDLFEAEVFDRRLNLRLLDKTAAAVVESLSDDLDETGAPESYRDLDAAYEAMSFEGYRDWCRRYLAPEKFAWWILRP